MLNIQIPPIFCNTTFLSFGHLYSTIVMVQLLEKEDGDDDRKSNIDKSSSITINTNILETILLKVCIFNENKYLCLLKMNRNIITVSRTRRCLNLLPCHAEMASMGNCKIQTNNKKKLFHAIRRLSVFGLVGWLGEPTNF